MTKRNKCICEEDNKLTQSLCPIHNSQNSTLEDWKDAFQKIWARAHIPDFALDAKERLMSLIGFELTHARSEAFAEGLAKGELRNAPYGANEQLEKIGEEERKKLREKLITTLNRC